MTDAFDPLIRRQRLMELLGVNSTTLFRWVREGRFPAPTILNPGSRRELVCWPTSVYLQWRKSLPQRTAKTARLTPYPKGVPRPRTPKLLGHNMGPPLDDDDESQAKPMITRPEK